MNKSMPAAKVDRVIRGAYDRTRLAFTVEGVSRTKQAFKAECDINTIMKRFERDGLLTHVAKFDGQYGDFTGAPEYHDAWNKILAADSMFLSLPAALRARFENDPGVFLEFVGNPANKQEMVALGLAKGPASVAVPAPAPAVVSDKK